MVKLRRNYFWIIYLLAAVNIYTQTPPRDNSGYIPIDNANTLPGQSGYINTSGQFILSQTFESAGDFSEGLADVKFNGTKWGYIDTTGKMVIQPQFDETNSFSEGLAAVRKGCNWGYINKSGEFAIPAQFNEALEFSDGFAIVKVNDKSGFIDPKGKWLIAPRSKWSFYNFSDEMARFEVSKESGLFYGFIDKSGKIAIKPKFNHAEDFSEGLAAVSKEGVYDSHALRWVDVKYGYIDKGGKVIIPFMFDWAGAFSNGVAQVELNGKRGIIDKTGKFSPQEKSRQYYGVKCFTENCYSGGIAPFELNNKYGFIDEAGNIIIQPQWREAGNFADGLAPVLTDNNKYGYIDRTGKIVIEPIFDKAGIFNNGIAVVTIFYERGRINEKGLWIK